MQPHRRFAAATAIALTMILAAAAGASARPAPHRFDFAGDGRGAVFVQTDNTAGNSVAVYDRSAGGSLSPAATYSTGGDGGILANSAVDHLASQNSLVYDADQRQLFAVNAGSNTVSVFAVHGDKLFLHQVIGSGGTFPVSIAVHGNLVYVLNALNGGSVQGYFLAFGNLIPIFGSARALGLDPTATPQFTNTPGDVAFTPDGSRLLVTTKANGNDIDVFRVGLFGRLSATPVVNNEPTDVPFSLAFEGDNQVAVGEAGPNAVADFALEPDGTLTPLSSVLTGGAATCWLVADDRLLFAGNAGSHSESGLLDSPSGALNLLTTTNTDAGTVDGAVSPDGRYLYVQTGGAGIVDAFRVGLGATLTGIGSVTVYGAIGGEGIATS